MCEWINTKVKTSDNMVDVLGLIPMGEPNEWVMRVVCYDDETNSWWYDGHKVKVDYWTVLPPKPVENGR